MSTRVLRLFFLSGFVCLAIWLLMPDAVQAVPSYARQTKLSCSSCHIVFPELNAYGRHFKLRGYTHVSSDSTINTDLLKLLKTPPLAVMAMTSFTNLNEEEPGTQNNNFSFPQQLSFFLSGEITPKLGSFIQVTYEDQSGSFSWDNTDIRYANHAVVGGGDLIYGVTLNNNPTVQDVWNSTPAWSYPYITSGIAPTPAAAALINGGLAQEVLGLGGYAFYGNTVYGEFTVYRSAQQGVPQPPDAASSDIIKAVSPYWRVALQHEWSRQYLEVGTYGLYSKIYPQGISGETNRYTDIAIDSEYHRDVGAKSHIVAHVTWIHEHQDLNAFYESGVSEQIANKLNTVKFDASYYYNRQFGPTFAYFSTTGTRDRGLYSPAEVFGSRTGEPDSDGIIVQLSYFPWLNFRLSLQYVAYFEFNGSEHNYDGFGRDASDNNTLYALAWLNF